MTTLNVILDPMLTQATRGTSRYTEELTRELIRLAPAGCDITGIVSAATDDEYARLKTLLPGLGRLHTRRTSSSARAWAWRHGLGSITRQGMVHATTLHAPLSKHDRLTHPSDQIVATIHDVAAWTHPELVEPKKAAWQKAMAKRARRYADAIIVPTHAVAAQLDEIHNFGDRLRVIGGAVSTKLQLPVDAAQRAQRLRLPERYVLSMGSPEPHKGIPALIEAMAQPEIADLPLLIAGPTRQAGRDIADLVAAAGLGPERVRGLGLLADADLAVALDRATVFAYPSLAGGFGLPVAEAFHFGTPVVHSDEPSALEISAGAGVSVPRADTEGYPARLAAALADVATQLERAQALRYQGLDRARAFSWSDSAQKVWQLHADL